MSYLPQFLTVHPYTRVIPRDLFNEAKLLKCLGLVCVNIHDGGLKGISFEFDPENELADFDIQLCDLGLFAANISFKTRNGSPVFLVSPYNSKSNYPLEFEGDGDYPQVFTDTGEFSEEFLEFLEAN